MFDFYLWFNVIGFCFLIIFIASLEFLKLIEQSKEEDRLSPYSKDFKIGDPVAVMHGGRLSFGYVASIVLSLRPDKFSNLYVLERSPFRSADYHFHDEELRHPTEEELEKYFRK